MPGDERVLVIMRHAKAEPFAAEDRLRRLTDRGRAAAEDVGRWASGHDVRPDHALVSPAVRTRQTWESFARGAGCSLDAVFDGSLYSAGTDTAMECLRSVPDAARCVVLVGHNPTVASLVQLLGDGRGDPEALMLVSTSFPPAAVAVFRCPTPWSGLDLGTARLERAYVGQG